ILAACLDLNVLYRIGLRAGVAVQHLAIRPAGVPRLEVPLGLPRSIRGMEVLRGEIRCLRHQRRRPRKDGQEDAGEQKQQQVSAWCGHRNSSRLWVLACWMAASRITGLDWDARCSRLACTLAYRRWCLDRRPTGAARDFATPRPEIGGRPA